MVGTANSGRRRTPIPTGDEATEELRRLRRQQRRAERRKRKAAEESGESLVGDESITDDPPPPVEFAGLPSPDELKTMFANAFADLGGVAGLVAWGRRYPKEFYPMWARICIPKDAGAGADEGSGLEAMLKQLDGRSNKELN